MLDFSNLSFTNIILNGLFAGILGTIIAHSVFFIIFRIFNYDYIFIRETGLLLVENNKYDPVVAGLLIHLVLVSLFMLLYALPYQILLILLSNNGLGIYTYSSNLLQQERIFLNVVYFVPFILIFIIMWIFLAKRSKGESQYPLLIVYCIFSTAISILMFSLYGFGHLEPGTVSLN